MTKVLIFLLLPEEVRREYQSRLKTGFPDLNIELARTYEEACAQIVDADILYTFGAMVRDDLYGHAKALKWVQALGTGLDNIIDAPSLSAKAIISSTRGIHGKPMSEAAFLFMLALSRDFPRALKAQRSHEWDRWPARLLHGKTVGILGVGLIAQDLAPRCKAFGMTVVGISRTPREMPGFDRFRHRDQLAEAVGDLDFLILLVPYENATRNIVDAHIFEAMKPSAYLINIARGGVVDEAALMEALQTGQIAGAAIDTFVQEPLPGDHRLWDAPNILITPHNAALNETYIDDALPQFEHNLRHFLAGDIQSMKNVDRLPGKY
ncbi:MAG: D-2-hydroxyacid dehydrogenase [Hyphomicrobiales bacterium]|nr:D-2-hydroxyacid dehydrogenase [Hyphomicrobiales bacterium]